MSSDEEKREYVKSLYPGARWKQNVNRMTISQVVAIYLKKRKSGDSR